MKQHLKTSARRLKLGCKLIFQMDNEPKHANKLVRKRLKDNKVSVLEWLSKSPDLSPTEHLSTYLTDFCQQEWTKLPAMLRKPTHSKGSNEYKSFSK